MIGSGTMGRGREIYIDCSREARKNLKAFFSGEQKNETLNNSDKNKKQEGWSSLNFLFGKCTFYTDFSTTVVKFLLSCHLLFLLQWAPLRVFWYYY